MFKKILLNVLLLCLISTIAFGSSSKKILPFKLDTLPTLPKATIGNWNNLMDPHGCVMLGSSNELKIKGVVTLGTNNLGNYPAMRLYMQFQDNPPEITNPINNWTFTAIDLAGIGTVYQLEVEGYNNNLNEECAINVDNPIPFSYTIKIIDEYGNDYPFDLYPELLEIAGMGDGTDPPLSIIPSTVYEGVKDLCCHGYSGTPMHGEGFVSTTNNPNTLENKSTPNEGNISNQNIDQVALTPSAEYLQPKVFPNPFSASLNINLQAKSGERLSIHFWDINGRLVHQTEYLSEYEGKHSMQINTSQLKAGFYFCSIKSGSQSQTFKVFKKPE